MIRWAASGSRRVDFFTGKFSEVPVTLWVNDTDRCVLKGPEEGFRSPKIHALMMNLLEKETVRSITGEAKNSGKPD